MLRNTYNVDFEVAAFVFATILYFYLRQKYYDVSEVNKKFRRLVLVHQVTLFLDLASAVTIAYSEYVPHFVNTLLNTLYFIFFGFTCYSSAMFYFLFVPPKEFKKNIKFVFLIILTAFNALILVNIKTGILFTFENGVFEHAPIYMLAFIMPLLYFVIVTVCFFCVKKETNPATFAVLLLLMALSVCGPLLQALFFPKVLLCNFFSIFALVFCLFTLISPNYIEMMDKRAQLMQLKNNLEERVLEESEKVLKNEERMKIFSGQIVDMLAQTINIGGANREKHSENVAKTSRLIAEELNLEEREIQKIYYMAILHDIGVIGIDEDVVEKKDVFTESEYEEMKRHSEIGAHILKTITVISGLEEGVRSHHERFDGNGYPDNLLGKNIPLSARIIAVADAYDSMTHERAYKRMYSPEDALDEIRRCAGTQFDPEIVDVFCKIVDRV